MFCGMCQRDIPAEATFCSYCGHQIRLAEPEAAEPAVTPALGSTIDLSRHGSEAAPGAPASASNSASHQPAPSAPHAPAPAPAALSKPACPQQGCSRPLGMALMGFGAWLLLIKLGWGWILLAGLLVMAGLRSTRRSSRQYQRMAGLFCMGAGLLLLSNWWWILAPGLFVGWMAVKH